MEQTRYWMWAKRRHGGLSSHHHLHQASATAAAAAYDDSSWEEQAFAEDAAGSLGGCVWPPRSYSCSFCGREFRSAQALGGHMNVHRRDRARLKQSPTPPGHDNNHLHHQNTDHHPFLPLGFHQYQPDQHHDELCNNFVYNPNPNPNPPSSPSSPKDKLHEKALFPTFTSPFVDDLHPKAKPTKSSSSPKSRSNKAAVERCNNNHFSDLRRTADGEIRSSSRILETGCRVKADYVHTKTDLSVSLNLVVLPTPSGSNMISKEESSVVGCKRKRSSSTDDHHPVLPFFLKPISIDRHLQPVNELSPSSSVDDIDLELRLGHRPKVK